MFCRQGALPGSGGNRCKSIRRCHNKDKPVQMEQTRLQRIKRDTASWNGYLCSLLVQACAHPFQFQAFVCIMTIVWQVQVDRGKWLDLSESLSRKAEQLWCDWQENKIGAWRIFDYKDGEQEYVIDFKRMIRMLFPSGAEQSVLRGHHRAPSSS